MTSKATTYNHGVPWEDGFGVTQGYSVNGTIYISGQVSTDDEGRVVGEGDLAAQTTQVMHNLGLALKAAGASYSNIVKITTFVVGYKPELRPIIGKARSVFFEGMEPPASTLVGVTALAAPEWLIEIEAVAVVD